MREKIFNLLKLLFGWPITIFALFFITRLIYEKTDSLILRFADINIFFLSLGALCFLCYFFLRVLLWQKILLSKNHLFFYKETAYLWAISEIRRFIPGNIFSLATRIFLFSEKKVEKKTVMFLMLQEAQSTVLGSAVFAVFSLSFVLYNLFPSLIVSPLLFISYVALALLCVLYVYKNPKAHFLFLSISVGAFFSFSLGTYFTILSIVTLSPYYLVTFLSFFSFSYLIGYLSIVTPMGLGVREGVMVFGLAQFITIPLAGLAAIYTRVILILTELLFFFLIRTWYYTKYSFVAHIEQFIKKYWREIIITLAIIVYVFYFTLSSFVRYDNFYAGRFDLGNMSQTVWNTTEGRIFQLTDPNGTEIISRLAFHADFFLILLAPLYKLWSDPKLLLFIQSIILGLGAIFVFQIANKVLKNKTIALFFAIAYLLNPSVGYTNLYDFHSVTLAITFLLGAFFFVLQRNYKWFIVFSFLAGITKENIWIIISFFGLYILIKEKNLPKKLFGLLISVVCVFIFYYLVWIAIPQARGGNHFALSYYSDFGDTPTNIIKNVLLSPQKIVDIMLEKDRVTYIYQLFSPLGFLPLAYPLFLLFALPDFSIALLSNNSQLRQIYYHYTAAITPFLFIAAIFGVRNVKKWYPKTYPFTIYYLLFATLYAAYAFGPLPGAKNPSIVMFTDPPKNKEVITKYLSTIEQSKSVAATNNLGANLTHREKLYTIPTGMYEADIIIFLLNDSSAQPSLSAQIAMSEELKKKPDYKLIFEKDDFVVFEKK